MKPQNHPQRQQARLRFLGIYALVLILPVVAVYLMAHVPAAGLQNENNYYKENIRQETRLIAYLDSLGRRLQQIQQYDKAMESAGGLQRGDYIASLQKSESGIRFYLDQMRQDSARLVAVNYKALSREIIGAYEGFLAYRNVIAELRRQLAQFGNSAKTIEDLKHELKEKDEALKQLQMVMLLQKSN